MDIETAFRVPISGQLPAKGHQQMEVWAPTHAQSRFNEGGNIKVGWQRIEFLPAFLIGLQFLLWYCVLEGTGIWHILALSMFGS